MPDATQPKARRGRRGGAAGARRRRLAKGALPSVEPEATESAKANSKASSGSPNYCYALHVPGDPNGRTYVGYTVDPARRLRQHNGELAGGARATSCRHGAWEFLFVVAYEDAPAAAEGRPAFGPHEGLSLEWHLKRGRGGGRRPPRGGLRGPAGGKRGVARRLELLGEALGLAKFAAHLPRLVVLVAAAHVDAAFAAVFGLPTEVCVLFLEEMSARLPGGRAMDPASVRRVVRPTACV